jgi:hypothetical protein
VARDYGKICGCFSELSTFKFHPIAPKHWFITKCCEKLNSEEALATIRFQALQNFNNPSQEEPFMFVSCPCSRTVCSWKGKKVDSVCISQKDTLEETPLFRLRYFKSLVSLSEDSCEPDYTGFSKQAGGKLL